jgi:hypothetical protein
MIVHLNARRRQHERCAWWHAGRMLGPALDAGFGGRSAALAEGAWWRTVRGAGVVVPDGAVDVMWSPGAGAWLAGPDTAPHTVELDVGNHVVGVRLRPGAASAVLGDDVDRATDRRVPLADVWPAALARHLHDALDRSTSPAGAAQLLAAAVCTRVGDDWVPDPMVVAAVTAIRAGAPPDPAGLSDRQLRRRFTRQMGYGTAFFRRVVRLDRFTRQLAARPGWSIARLAAECGYADESHLWRDCVALSGSTPASFR